MAKDDERDILFCTILGTSYPNRKWILFWLCDADLPLADWLWKCEQTRAHSRQLIIVCENEISEAIEMRRILGWLELGVGNGSVPAKIDQRNF